MNNNFMRQGQNNNRNRNRNRGRQRTGGNSSSSGSGGNSSNKVFDSNGPDVKLRGNAQTIAEKYMQLGRDTQSSGDSVSAESYYQHAEHYYRVWASNQPVGASLIMSRKLGEEEFEEDGQGAEDDGLDAPTAEGAALEGAEAPQGDGQPQQGPDDQQRPLNNNNRNGRERFKPRWQRGRDRWQNQDGTGDPGQQPQQNQPEAQPQQNQPVAEDAGQWEAPSFLQRPTPAPAPIAAVADAEVAEPARRGRPRRERSEATPAPDDATPATE